MRAAADLRVKKTGCGCCMCLIGLKNEETRAAADLRIKKMYMLHVSNRVKQWGREGSSRPTSKETDACV